jgi:hypothetical protein
MDDHARDELVARLSDAERGRSTLRLKMQAHAASIDETRQALGNPYFTVKKHKATQNRGRDLPGTRVTNQPFNSGKSCAILTS